MAFSLPRSSRTRSGGGKCLAGHDHRRGPSSDNSTKGYVPTLSDERAERPRLWHERVYAEGRAEGRRQQTFDYLGTRLVVPPEVMPVTATSHLLGEAVLGEAEAGERVPPGSESQRVKVSGTGPL